MSYELAFHEDALKEWKKLDASIKDQFRKQLEKRLAEPRVQSAKLSGKDMKDVYKIAARCRVPTDVRGFRSYRHCAGARCWTTGQG